MEGQLRTKESSGPPDPRTILVVREGCGFGPLQESGRGSGIGEETHYGS